MPAPAAAPIASDPTAVAAAIPASSVTYRRAAARTEVPDDCRLAQADLLRRHRPALERVVACSCVPVPEREERRLFDVAMARMEARAARMEPAAGRWVDRIRHVALEHELAALSSELRR